MKNLGKFAVLGTAVAVFASLATTAHASVFGTAYCDIESSTGNQQQGTGYAIQTPTIGSALANAESTSAGECATFTASGINFATGSDATNPVAPSGVLGGNSLADFLNYGSDIVGSVSYNASLVGTSANGGQTIQANGAQDDGGTLFVLTGSNTLTTGESIILNHDDGALIYVCLASGTCNSSTGAGYTLISPAGSGTQTVDGQSPFTFSGASGIYDFELIFNSNYEQPSDLQSSIAATPEPSSLMLLGTGLFSAAGMLFRRRQAA